ncbi:hypothetical protein [Fredinandcohnia sp. 179-A 10B2 NHS]|uniref:hypothetical protein n=1 Tax=Fredinandcohnia sp. 179-A 10B2 NHS TaxID=3235176 RepID=UPI00399FC2D8
MNEHVKKAFIGDKVTIYHRKSPFLEMKKEEATITGKGVTKDGIRYLEATAGSFTKKFVY